MTAESTKTYTGRTGERWSFAGRIDYREYSDESGTLQWEGYGRSDDRRIEDFREIRDSIPDEWRTDTEGLDLETAPADLLVNHWGDTAAPPGAVYNRDYTETFYYNGLGARVYYVRHARYAISHKHVESRGCACHIDPCECPDEVFKPYESWAMFKRVANGWIEMNLGEDK